MPHCTPSGYATDIGLNYRSQKLNIWLHFQDCYFACEYHGGLIALRDAQGLYLAPIGSRAVLKTRSNTVTKDELFSLEDSLPQASFVAASNARYVSIKQGKTLKIVESMYVTAMLCLYGFFFYLIIDRICSRS